MFARCWNVLRREPLAHFLVLAALLFLADDLLAPPEREAIVIAQTSIDQLVRQQEELLARPLTDDERRAVTESAIDDEVLLREAYRRGLDRDAVVRQHLVEKMRFILGEGEPEPTAAELKEYLAANRERYRTPPAVTLDHVFYADPGAVPDGLLVQLENGLEIDGLGDSLYMLGNRLPRYSLRDLIGLMGPDVARRVFELPAGSWRPDAVRARRAFRPGCGAPPAGNAELRGAGGLSAAGLGARRATPRDHRQARRAAPELSDRGQAGALMRARGQP